MGEGNARKTLFTDLDLIEKLDVLAVDGEHLDRAVMPRGKQQCPLSIDRQSIGVTADVHLADQLRWRSLDIDYLHEIVEYFLLGRVVVACRRSDDYQLAVRGDGDSLWRSLHGVLETFHRSLDDRWEG